MRSQAEKYFKIPGDEGYFREVLIQEGRYIGEGAYGLVSEVTASVKKNGRHKEITCARKEYKKPGYARAAWENYQLVKKAELPTWTTCRLSEDGMKLLMTNGETENLIVTSTMPSSKSAFDTIRKGKIKIDEQEIRSICQQAAHIAQEAYKKRLWVPADAYLFRLHPPYSNLRDVQIIIGDLDGISLGSGHLIQNMERAKLAVAYFLEHHAEDGQGGSLIADIMKEFFP